MAGAEHREAEGVSPNTASTSGLLLAMLSGLPPAILREAAQAAERREWREREFKKLVARDVEEAEAAEASAEAQGPA